MRSASRISLPANDGGLARAIEWFAQQFQDPYRLFLWLSVSGCFVIFEHADSGGSLVAVTVGGHDDAHWDRYAKLW